MICMDCDTEITGKPVCRATRSAVRCRVPVSSEGIVWSGIRCTAARMMRVMSRSTMIPPSILASSRSPVAVKGTSRAKPPVEIDSTVLSLPSTIRAPVRPRRIRSSPSRRRVPGAVDGQGRAQPQLLVRCARRPHVLRPGAASDAGRHGSMPSREPSRSSTASRACLVRRVEMQQAQRRDTSGASTTRSPRPSRSGAAPGPPGWTGSPGTTAIWKPSRAASARRCGRSRTRRSSPARPISPIATTPAGGGLTKVAEASATATARSLAGSVSWAPPTVEAKTSWPCEPDAAVLLEHGQHHGDRGTVEARGGAAGPLQRPRA